MSDLGGLFRQHVETRIAGARVALEETGFDALVVGAGSGSLYYADDQESFFHANPHFRHWCPLGGPHHAVAFRSGKKPLVVRWAPQDYWYESAPFEPSFWTDAFDIEEAADAEGVMKRAAAFAGARAAFVGADGALAETHGLQANPPGLLSRLDWDRAKKTAYEIACLEEATIASAKGHRAAREAFERGESELAIHHAYVKAAGSTDDALPYPTIVCLDEKAAVLHYHAKRAVGSGHNLLIDAGASSRGYGCDITRTATRDGADNRFTALIAGVDALEQRLCAMVKPGLPYPEIHFAAHREIASLLVSSGLLKCSADEALSKGYTTPFFPHGVGHHLGILVHDSGGHQKAREGGTLPPPLAHPYLRNTRTIEEGHVFTIEPGLYFIKMLLAPFRNDSQKSAAFNWPLIDALTPLGGIRIEDNVVVTKTGHRNLTREQLN